MKNKVLLCVLDGFGIGQKNSSNAIFTANTKNFDYIFKNSLYLNIHASGEFVGLPPKQMGNSEVGHLTLGCGRIISQSLPLINSEIKNKNFFKNEAFLKAIDKVKKTKGVLHFCGLTSSGGVHSHINHLKALIDLVREYDIEIYVHLITDGRDTKKDIAYDEINELLEFIGKHKNIKIATIAGRFYAMDRDKRWERIKKAISAMFSDKNSQKFTNVLDYIKKSYSNKVYDEFIVPAYNENIHPKITSKDSFIMFNFRQDRAIQISSFLSNENYEFRNKDFYFPKDLLFVSMRTYSDSVKGLVAYPFQKINNNLGSYISKFNLSQLRIAETEKYAHVTYFFDGGVNVVYKNEKRLLIPSPKVETYDLIPEMACRQITHALLKEIGKHDLIVLNFANSDMVGHTGNFDATVKAIEFLDEEIKKIYDQCLLDNTILIITADHGNAELMTNNGQIVKSHTNNMIPLSISTKNYSFSNEALNSEIGLKDIATTILYLFNLKKPQEMTGKILLKERGK